MVHVGESKFYRDTYQDAFSHDVALVEGVRSPVVRNLTRSYRWIDFERLALVVQPNFPAQADVGARIVLADLPSGEFEMHWRAIPLAKRAMLFVLAPLYGLYMRLLATREDIAGRLALEDLASREEMLNWNPAYVSLGVAIHHARDERLLECIGAELADEHATEKRIAVVYGARHMRAVLRRLTRQGFVCTDSQWRQVL